MLTDVVLDNGLSVIHWYTSRWCLKSNRVDQRIATTQAVDTLIVRDRGGIVEVYLLQYPNTNLNYLIPNL